MEVDSFSLIVVGGGAAAAAAAVCFASTPNIGLFGLISSRPSPPSIFAGVATAVAAAAAARAAWRRAKGRWAVVFRWCLLLMLSVPARGSDGRFLVWLFCC